MKRERYSIIYSSKTGNTKKLAEAIYNTLPQNKCDYYGTVDKIDDVLSNVIYIGFWTEKGNADHLTIDFLNKLKNKKIFLFGTAGYGESEKYFEGIINNVKKNIDSSNTIIGSFMCQGKMPLSVRERYEKMREQNNISLNIDKLIANFDKALSHPNTDDLKTLDPTKKYVMTNQTTMSLYDVYDLCEKAKEILPFVEIEKETCTATKIRQEAIKNIEDDVDIIFIVGDPHSNNTRKLASIAHDYHTCDVYMIESIEDLEIEWLKNKRYAAVSSGASTPTYLTNQVIDYLKQFDINDSKTYQKPIIDKNKILNQKDA